MNDDASAPAAPSDQLTELRLALGFLTILPVIDRRGMPEQTVAASFQWFPAIGLLMGIALAVEDWWLANFFGQTIRSVLIILTLTVVTGAVHLDGLADTADALGAGHDRERALDILRDSRVGTFGASAIFFDLILKILALSTNTGHRAFTLSLAPMFARWAMLLVAAGLPYLRTNGAGSTLLSDDRPGLLATMIMPGAIWVTIAVVILAVFQGATSPIVLPTVVTIAIVFAMRSFYRRWLGGVTGDLIGACGELVEIAIFVMMAS